LRERDEDLDGYWCIVAGDDEYIQATEGRIKMAVETSCANGRLKAPDNRTLKRIGFY